MRRIFFLLFFLSFLTGCGQKQDLDFYVSEKYNFRFGYPKDVAIEEEVPQNSLLKLNLIKKNGGPANTAGLGGFFVWNEPMEKYLKDWEASKVAKSFERDDKKSNGNKFVVLSMVGEESEQKIITIEKDGRTFAFVLSYPKDDKTDPPAVIAGLEEAYLDSFEFLK